MNAVLRPPCGPDPDPAAGLLHRPMAVADLASVLAIESVAYSHPWNRANFVDSIAAGYSAELRLQAGGGVVGYFVALPGFEESHLLNLTVAPAWQRAGHGQALLQRVMQLARQRGDQALWLEVRPSNVAALALYQRLGFAQVGCRRNYYPAPNQRREDALVLRKALVGDSDALV